MGAAEYPGYQWLGAQQMGIVAGGCYQQAIEAPYQNAEMQQAGQLMSGMSGRDFQNLWNAGPLKARANALLSAEQLLQDHLTPEQRHDLLHFGWFDVRGKWRRPLHRSTWHTFRIYGGGAVRELKRGGGTRDYCIISLECVPSPDVMLTLKLLVEGDLNRFYKTARPLN
jgi:hypothetical protein